MAPRYAAVLLAALLAATAAADAQLTCSDATPVPGTYNNVEPGSSFSVRLASPSSTAALGNRLDCTWTVCTISNATLSVPAGGLVIDTEEGFDAVRLYGGPTVSSPELVGDGQGLSGELTTSAALGGTSACLTLRLQTDGSVPSSRVQATFLASSTAGSGLGSTCSDAAPAPGRYTLDPHASGGAATLAIRLVSPEGTPALDDNLDCSWTVCTASDSALSLPAGGLVVDTEATHDRVTLHSGTSASAAALLTLSGVASNDDAVAPSASSVPCLTLRLRTDGSVASTSVVANFVAVSRSDNGGSDGLACDNTTVGRGQSTLTVPRGGFLNVSLGTYNFPGLIASNLGCVWEVCAADQGKLRVRENGARAVSEDVGDRVVVRNNDGTGLVMAQGGGSVYGNTNERVSAQSCVTLQFDTSPATDTRAQGLGVFFYWVEPTADSSEMLTCAGASPPPGVYTLDAEDGPGSLGIELSSDTLFMENDLICAWVVCASSGHVWLPAGAVDVNTEPHHDTVSVYDGDGGGAHARQSTGRLLEMSGRASSGAVTPSGNCVSVVLVTDASVSSTFFSARVEVRDTEPSSSSGSSASAALIVVPVVVGLGGMVAGVVAFREHKRRQNAAAGAPPGGPAVVAMRPVAAVEGAPVPQATDRQPYLDGPLPPFAPPSYEEVSAEGQQPGAQGLPQTPFPQAAYAQNPLAYGPGAYPAPPAYAPAVAAQPGMAPLQQQPGMGPAQQQPGAGFGPPPGHHPVNPLAYGEPGAPGVQAAAPPYYGSGPPAGPGEGPH